MNSLKLKTNINCSSCVAKTTPFLNNEKSIQQWQVDTDSPDKILSIQGVNLSLEQISTIVSQAGFKVLGEIYVGEKRSKGNFWANFDVWKRASFNTLNCLIGCSIGDFGTMIYFQANHIHIPMWTMMSIAIAMGLLTSVIFETIILRIKEGFSFSLALKTAFSMSFISMLVMEISENMADYFLTGGGQVPVTNAYYWMALSISLLVGFIVPLPYNYYKLRKYGKACH